MKDWFQEAPKPPENRRYDISSEDICLKQPPFVTQHGKVLWFTWHFSRLHPKRDRMHYVNDSLFPRAVDRPCQYNDIAGPIPLSCPLTSVQTGRESSCWLFRPFLWTTSQSSVLLHSLCHVILNVWAWGSNIYADIHKCNQIWIAKWRVHYF